jgi:hypothetical protein
MITILSLAFADQIDATRQRIRSNVVAEAILNATSDWASAGELKRLVAKACEVSSRTVERQISALVGVGALHTRGGGPSVVYKATGII